MTTRKPASRGFAALLAAAALCGAPALHATVARTLPPSLRPALYRALAGDGTSARPIGADDCATLEGSGLKACFDSGGQRFAAPGGAAVTLRLTAYGRGGVLATVAAVRPVVAGNRVTYRHAGLDEWWRALPVGFEQGFTIGQRPRGDGPLVLALAAGRGPVAAEGDLAWGALRYGGLVVTDARGRTIPATLKSRGRRVLITVNDAGAQYPLTVDPLVWIEQKVTASDGAAGDEFGWAVAVSGDNALVGAPYATVNGLPNVGAVYAFTLSNGTWAQTQKLNESNTASGDGFGGSLALDGETALIGAPTKTINGIVGEGAAYVFTFANGIWTQRKQLTRSTGLANAGFGSAVGLSGNTAVIGGSSSQHAAYVFTGSGSAWVQSAILTASDGTSGDKFGTAVAVDGTTALVGASGAIDSGIAAGAVYVFTNSGGTWTQAQKLAASDGVAGDAFGSAVSLSGGTALAGAPHATVNGQADNGAVYVFTNSGGTWNQTQKFDPTGDSPSGLFGSRIALSGNNLLVGAPALNNAQGAAYVFASSNGNWTEEQELTAREPADGDAFGYDVALDGATALAGAFGVQVSGNSQQGAAYFYGGSDLSLAISAPATVNGGSRYTSESIVTNNSTGDSAAISLLITVPNYTGYVAANATQGQCGLGGGTVVCELGAIAGNGGSATATVTLEATGGNGSVIDNQVSVNQAEPALSASAPTSIMGNGGGGGGGGGGSGGGGGATGPATLALLGLAALFAFAKRRR